MKTDTVCQETPCDRGVAERPRYYARQLITSDDLTLEQEYFRNKLRAHNRLLHGWGVVCGAHVCPRPDGNGSYKAWEVVVEPGYILGPYGDEIVIDRQRVIDLRTTGLIGATGDPGMESIDPWCSQVYVPRSLTGDLFIAVRYRECQTRPVRVQPSGCSCDDNPCEYSRLQDGYDISVLDYCPENNIQPPGQLGTVPEVVAYPGRVGLMTGTEGVCVQCPPEPWVALAKVTVDDDGAIAEIDNCECRRIVISFADSALRCHTEKPTLTGIDPARVKAGENREVTLTGTNFKAPMKVSFGPGIAVNYIAGQPESNIKTKVRISVDDNPQTGGRAITLINPDCATATFLDKLQVDAPLLKVGPPIEETEGTIVMTKAASKARPRKRVASKKKKT